jgi:hypothetical protein
MERFLPILEKIQIRLRDILTRNEYFISTWNIEKLSIIGEDLVLLAHDFYSHLIRVEHRVLYVVLREAGLGIKDRVVMVKNRKLEGSDKKYFRNVYDVLNNLCKKIESGEYYKALLNVADSQQK